MALLKYEEQSLAILEQLSMQVVKAKFVELRAKGYNKEKIDFLKDT